MELHEATNWPRLARKVLGPPVVDDKSRQLGQAACRDIVTEMAGEGINKSSGADAMVDWREAARRADDALVKGGKVRAGHRVQRVEHAG